MSVKINRIDNKTYSFRFSDKCGIKAVAKSLTFPNPNPISRNKTIEFFDKKNLTFGLGMITTVKRYLDDNEIELLSYYGNKFDYEDADSFSDGCRIGDSYSPWVYVGAFMHCQNLESVYIPKVKKFGDRTFFDCQKLRTINKNNILNNVTSLGISVFHNCKRLKNNCKSIQ